MNVTTVTYGVGGFDPTKPNNNVVSTTTKATSPEQDNAAAIQAADATT